MKNALARPWPTRQEGPGDAPRSAEVEGLLARQSADIEDLKVRLAGSDWLLDETRQALRDNQQVLADTQKALQEAVAAPSVSQRGPPAPGGLAAVAGPPAIMTLVALVEDFMSLDPLDIYTFAVGLLGHLEGQPPTVGRRQLITAVTEVVNKYSDAVEDPP